MQLCLAPQPAVRVIADQKPAAPFAVDREFGMARQKFVDRGERARTGRAKEGLDVNDAVLHEQPAARRHEPAVRFQFPRHVCLRMIAVENDADGAPRTRRP